MNKGFTMIELLIVIAIISILSSVVFLNWKSGEAGFALQNSAYKLSQDIREMQEMAMEAREMDCGGGDTGLSFGVQFKSSWSYYLLFVDCNSNYRQDSGEDFKIINFEKGVEISNLSPSSFFGIVFTPPDPITYIKGSSSGTIAEIILSLEDYPSRQRTITVNTSGMIEIK
ncbi:prepilin-type N-terminal cleavage/methylation domain-containing protein [Candidatus Atribacteria bacterium MT.SAG.1]|nr:prepilin-type N-terminal cleavage/methylation domain-containing protein [Candidatus Atribacteria bacterium MT.SAG.1]